MSTGLYDSCSMGELLCGRSSVAATGTLSFLTITFRKS